VKVLGSEEIVCERILDLDHWLYKGPMKTCLIKQTTVIDTENVPVESHDDSILGFDIVDNKKVSFLPVRVAKAFPNLVAYSAYHCSIKKIAKKNFARLTKLKQLGLHNNKIERIHSKVFEDLVSLEHLILSKKTRFDSI
jgi:Leucine-rich repeat (LRR) protein